MRQNTRVVLAHYIEDVAGPKTFRIESGEVPDPGPGEVLVRIEHLSLDPYMRNRLTTMKSYARGVQLGEVIVGETVGRVVESRNPAYAVGQTVRGSGGWQEYHVSEGTDLRVLPESELSPTVHLGVLGMPGFTAWIAVQVIGAVQPGETVVVPAATGPLGSTIGQIAKRLGARAVGVVGGPEKVALASEAYGFDAVVDHRADDFARLLADACPDGVDVYADSVGGKVLTAVTPLMNLFGRIPLIGTIADYGELSNPTSVNERPALTRATLVKRLTIRGLLVHDFASEVQPFETAMTRWLLDGSVTYREEVHQGIRSAPAAFERMMAGRHLGKIVVQVTHG
jgi:NADPH-dependent curcumin reductase CurA